MVFEFLADIANFLLALENWKDKKKKKQEEPKTNND